MKIDLSAICYTLMHSFITRLYLNILLSCIVSANADTPIWGVIGIPADTPSNLMFTLSPCQSTGQIDWHAWSTFRAWRTLALGFQCVDFCVNKFSLMTHPIGFEVFPAWVSPHVQPISIKVLTLEHRSNLTQCQFDWRRHFNPSTMLDLERLWMCFMTHIQTRAYEDR